MKKSQNEPSDVPELSHWGKKPELSKSSHFENLIFDKIHIFQSIIFHKIYIFRMSYLTKLTFLKHQFPEFLDKKLVFAPITKDCEPFVPEFQNNPVL